MQQRDLDQESNPGALQRGQSLCMSQTTPHATTFKDDLMNFLANICTASSYRAILSFIFVTFKRQGTQTQ